MADTIASPFKGRCIRDIPASADSFTCVALVKPGSRIAQDWNLQKPAFCIYEFTAWAVDKHSIRWGDGSGQSIAAEDFDSLILLRELGEPALDALFNA
jgi:hypothetical protein